MPASPPPRPATVLLDIDGTLLDSNDAHALAWVEALCRHGHEVAFERVRGLIGKGGEKVLDELAGLADDSPEGEAVKADRKALFLREHLPRLAPTPGARALVEGLQQRGCTVVIATSAGSDELDALLKQAGVDDLLELTTTSDDAEHSKPDPDIVQAALGRAGIGPADALMVGDTPYDIEAAAAAGVVTVALRCGGHWSDAALGGAVAICDDPADLLARWDEVHRAAAARG